MPIDERGLGRVAAQRDEEGGSQRLWSRALRGAGVSLSRWPRVTSAQAVIPGENGRIVLISGRTNGDVGSGGSFCCPWIGSFGGAPEPPVAAALVGDPALGIRPGPGPDDDRADARGDSATGSFDIYAQLSLTAGFGTRSTSRSRTASPTYRP